MISGFNHSNAERSFLHRIVVRSRSRFNITMAVVLATLTLGELLLARRVHLSGAAQLLDAWPGLLLVLGALFYCEYRTLVRLIDPCELIVWAVLSSNVLAMMVQLAARSPSPLADEKLAMLDHSMHFDTAAIADIAAHFPIARDVLAVAYAAIPLLVFAALLIPPFYGQRLASRRYIVSLIVTTIFTSILFAVWPACGPWTTEHLHPTREQAAITARLLFLKAAATASLDFDHTAIVSFPSFHVVLALLSAVALNRVPRVRVPVWILAALTCVSTLTTGWHYGIDLLGGVAVTVAGWSLARLAVPHEAETVRVPRFEPLVRPVDFPA